MNKVWVSLLFGMCAASPTLAITIFSGFDSGSEGWTTYQISGGTQWVSAGGNPDGHISAADDMSGWGYFKAPSTYTAQAASYGSSFNFNLKHTSGNGTLTMYKVRVAIQGAGLTLINESVLPTASWQNYSFTLNESSGWRKFSNVNQNYASGAPTPTLAEMQSVLGSMTALYIAADYNDETTPPNDVTYLDNVALQAVPEPATMIALALGAAMAIRRRR